MKKIENLTVKSLDKKIRAEFETISENGASIIFVGPISEPFDYDGTPTQQVLVNMGLYDNNTGYPYSQLWDMYWDTNEGVFHTLKAAGEKNYVAA